MRSMLAAQGIANETLANVEIILAEVLNNIVEHALSHKTKGWFHLRCDRHTYELVFSVRDNGCPLPEDHLRAAMPPRALHDPQHIPEGGRGWTIIHSLAQDLSYNRNSGQNVLKFHMPLERTH